MPIYEFECDECSEKFELLLGLHYDPKEVRCPKCKAAGSRRLMSGFSSSGSRSTGSSCSSTGST